MSLYKPVFVERRVTLSPAEYKDAVEDLDKFLTKKLRKEFEGKCSQHGWIRPGSTSIIARSMGQAEHGRFTADFIFYCKVRAMCLSPYTNQIVEGQILKANKMGAYVLVISDGSVQDAMRILVPRDLHLGNAEFEQLSAGENVRVRVLRSRFQAGDEFIQAVGTYEGRSAATVEQEGKEGKEGKEAKENKETVVTVEESA